MTVTFYVKFSTFPSKLKVIGPPSCLPVNMHFQYSSCDPCPILIIPITLVMYQRVVMTSHGGCGQTGCDSTVWKPRPYSVLLLVDSTRFLTSHWQGDPTPFRSSGLSVTLALISTRIIRCGLKLYGLLRAVSLFSVRSAASVDQSAG